MAGYGPCHGTSNDLERAEYLKMINAHTTLCFSHNGLKSWGQFAADVELLREQTSHASHICNLLPDRYDFMVGIAAALLNNQVTVLPAAVAPQAIRNALAEAEHPLILGGEQKHHGTFANLTTIPQSDNIVEPDRTLSALAVSKTQIHVFTSGTTKMPERLIKGWKTLVGGAAVTEEILAKLDLQSGTTAMLGTTPHQHMYGLEATVFLGLGFGHCVYGATVFFPADLEIAVESAIAGEFRKAVLVTSPAHLKFFETTLLETDEICAVISATAPLSYAQAERLEARGNLAVMEIYGSTETGSLAIRRTIEGDLWEPVAGFQVVQTDEGPLASAPHLSEPCLLGDAIDLRPDGRFRLLGRTGDMIGIAGKRGNLSALNAILIETSCLLDGVVLRQRSEGDDQLAIVAVLDPQSGLSVPQARTEIRRQFHNHVDGVFLPRRILFIDSLPRTPTGKINAEGMEQLLKVALATPSA
jgi:acyl-coenzyme A synthetase/AMP-(fatty) acid ligase